VTEAWSILPSNMLALRCFRLSLYLLKPGVHHLVYYLLLLLLFYLYCGKSHYFAAIKVCSSIHFQDVTFVLGPLHCSINKGDSSLCLVMIIRTLFLFAAFCTWPMASQSVLGSASSHQTNCKTKFLS